MNKLETIDELEERMFLAIKYQLSFNQNNKDAQLIACAKNCAIIARQFSENEHNEIIHQMETTKKLYRVTLRGMKYSDNNTAYGISYVVANNSDEAYQKVRSFLNENDIGFSKDRELECVELIAEESKYTDTGTILYL